MDDMDARFQISDLEMKTTSLKHNSDRYEKKIQTLEETVKELTKQKAKIAEDLAMILDYLKLEIKDVPAKRIITEKLPFD